MSEQRKTARVDREQPQGSDGVADRRTAVLRLRAFPCSSRRSTRCSEGAQGFGGAGVLEVVEDDAGGTYRAVYTVKFAEAVFVLHCFQKKSKSGIATPKADMDIIRARLKVAEAFAKELRNEKTNH